jgi:excinuclease UvrABC nuclease subunit
MCREEVGRIPGRVPGVYLLHAFAAEFGGYPVCYVGQSADLRRRLFQHTNLRSAKPIITAIRRVSTTYFSAAPVTDPKERLEYEAALIAALQPPFNEQQPRAYRRLPDLPPLFIRFSEEGFDD